MYKTYFVFDMAKAWSNKTPGASLLIKTRNWKSIFIVGITFKVYKSNSYYMFFTAILGFVEIRFELTFWGNN